MINFGTRNRFTLTSPFSNPLINRVNPINFGYDIPLPQQQTQQSQATPFDFISEYNKVAGNRPNRLAYQQAIMQGEPVINRSKWARLGAALAAGGAALGGTPAPQAAQFGISSYMQPQMRATEEYQNRLRNLGALAGMENEDIADKLKLLEMQREDYYKGEQLGLQKKEFGLREAEDKRQETELIQRGLLNQAQIDNIKDEMLRRDIEEYIDESTGTKFKKNMKTGQIDTIGKVGLTPKEKAAAVGSEEAAREGAREPGRKARDIAEMERVKEAAKGRETVANINAQARRDTVNKKVLGALKPGEQAQQVWVDLQQLFASNPDLAGKNIEDYVDLSVGPEGNHVISTKPSSSLMGLANDSPETVGIKSIINKTIADSIAKSKNPVTNQTPNINQNPNVNQTGYTDTQKQKAREIVISHGMSPSDVNIKYVLDNPSIFGVIK